MVDIDALALSDARGNLAQFAPPTSWELFEGDVLHNDAIAKMKDQHKRDYWSIIAANLPYLPWPLT